VIAVVDASAAMEIVLERPRAEEFKAIVDASAFTLAPDVFAAEITNAFWKCRSFGGIKDESCMYGIEFCLGLIEDYVMTGSLWHEAFLGSVKHEHSVYDLLYIVVARRNNATLLTTDKKLKKIAKELGVKVV
jgi:predicted nucleic acid-binding protein